MGRAKGRVILYCNIARDGEITLDAQDRTDEGRVCIGGADAKAEADYRRMVTLNAGKDGIYLFCPGVEQAKGDDMAAFKAVQTFAALIARLMDRIN